MLSKSPRASRIGSLSAEKSANPTASAGTRVLKIITLIGYRGTGKTTVARPLAERLGWRAVDADVELERRAGRSIREIFATDGEAEFRRLERETLRELLTQEQLVIAAGGGAIINPQTRADFKAAGPVVWLKASIDTIEQRLHGDATTRERRPNLTTSGGRAEIEQMLALREPLYRDCATIVVDTDQPWPGDCDAPSVARIVDFILERLGNLTGQEAT